MQGKTAEEVAQIAQNLYGTVDQMYRAAPQVQAPRTETPAVNINTLGDDDVVSGRELKAILAQAGQNIGGSLAGLYGMQGDTNLRSLQGQYKTVFDKYGHEVMTKVAGLPVEMRSLQNLETVVKLVQGDLVQDLARELAMEMASQQDPTFRSNGGSSSGAPNRASGGRLTERDDIPAAYREMMARKGITDETVREFARANQISPEQWLEQAKRWDGSLITERHVTDKRRSAQ